jgi:hypothetical protein
MPLQLLGQLGLKHSAPANHSQPLTFHMYFRFLSCLCGILVHPSGFRHKLCGERASTDEISSDPMSIDIFEIPVHPAADAFPMMDEEELEELAQDIKANPATAPSR